MTDTDTCERCEGTGEAYVAHYGGHTVPCGACGGTGTTPNTDQNAALETKRRTPHDRP
ncbi:hypothetical protein [Glycomyces paridis]|uniref:hypothetical protein n=1 Tax=Glycomyces paridis TaxID=2126555 RepID=UPI00130518F1|nr:hypothetical protein [Glycomyces paridis]